MELQILLTAGPTREFIDDVRYLSNRSSGRMGFALAREFAALGAYVTVIAGPTEVPPPTGEPGIAVESVVSARDMFEAVAERFATCTVFVAAAAVADYRPAERQMGKIKKTADALTIELVPNPDILFEMGHRRTASQTVVGFALEVAAPLENANEKLRRKNCDLIVLNSPENFGSGTSPLTIIGATGILTTITGATKFETAATLAAVILDFHRQRQHQSQSQSQTTDHTVAP